MVTRSKTCLGFVLLLISCMVNEVKAESSQKWQVYTEWPFNATEAKRRQEETAKALGIPVEKTMDLGNGVTLELVLIPAGRFIMGTPEPEGRFLGLVTFWVGAGILLVLVLVSVYRARKNHRWLQFSLRYFMLMAFVCSIGLWGGVRWWQTRAEWARYERSSDSEKPAHEVTLSRPFYMGKYEVTQEQYQQVTGNVAWRLPTKFWSSGNNRRGTVRMREQEEGDWMLMANFSTRVREGTDTVGGHKELSNGSRKTVHVLVPSQV